MSANPLDWPGPEFLAFYVVLGLAVNLGYRWLQHRWEGCVSRDCRRLELINDPYQIAYLRGGTPETLRVVLVSLIDRGLLKAAGANVIPAVKDPERWTRRGLERGVLQFFSQKPARMVDMYKDRGLRALADMYDTTLAGEGLLKNVTVIMSRLPLALPMFVVLDGTGLLKIGVALSRGKHNLAFLLILMVIFTLVLIKAVAKRRTATGDDVMRQLKEAFAQLKARAAGLRPGGATNEVAMAAAIFGLAVLPPASFPYVREMFPKASDSSTSGSGCSGSGCAGASGSSCGGSSCGGGGCGGGCGGCGG